MSWQRVDLCRDSLRFSSAKLQLDVEATANLNPAGLTGKLSKTSQIVPLLFEDVWISKGHDFHLSFSFSFDARLRFSCQQQASLLEHIGRTLKSAELWRQLSLTASLTTPDIRPTGSSESPEVFVLNLYNTLDHKSHGSEGPQQLSQSSCEVTNLRPPDAVPSILLSSANIAFHFSPELRSDQPRSIWTKASPTDLMVSIRSQMESYPVSVSIVTSLVDAGFRNLICPRPIRLFPGIKSWDGNRCSHLANLAPGVFLPGYARNIADRACFIPPIAKVLTSFVDRAAYTNVQRHRAQLLRRSNLPSTQTRENGNSGGDTNEIKSTVSGHLWLTLTNALRNLEPARRLRPLRNQGDNSTTMKSKHEDHEEILGQSVFDDCLDTHFSVSQDFEQILLGLEDESSSEMADEFMFDLYEASRVGKSATAGLLSENICFYKANDTLYKADDTFMSLESVGQRPGKVLQCYPDKNGDAGSMLSSARSAAYVGEELRTASTGAEELFHMESCALARSATPVIDAMHAAESAYWEAPSLGVMNVIGDFDLLTESGIRQHPCQTLPFDGGQLVSPSSSVFEDVDCCEFDYGQFDRLSPVSQNDKEEAKSAKSVLGKDQALLEKEKELLISTDMAGERLEHRISLSDVLGGDHLMWHMWKRRASVAPRDDDILEMHAMYSGDPDMRLSIKRIKTNGDTREELRDDEEMLDAELSSASSNSPVMSPASDDDAFHAFSYPRKQSTDRSPASRPTTASTSGLSSSRPRTQRGQSFLNRISAALVPSRRTSVDTQSQDFRSQPREMEIKRRKTLEDYEMMPDGDQMLLN